MDDTKGPQVSHELHPVSTVVRDHIAEQGAGHETDVVLLDAGAAHLEKGQLHGLKLAKDNHTVCSGSSIEPIVMTISRFSFHNLPQTPMIR